jgi:hypothetical protein
MQTKLHHEYCPLVCPFAEAPNLSNLVTDYTIFPGTTQSRHFPEDFLGIFTQFIYLP